MSAGGSHAAVFQSTGSFEHDAATAARHDDAAETVLAFDFGMRRIGVAVGNTRLRIAHPLTTITAEDNRGRLQAIAALVEEWQPARFIVGHPAGGTGEPHPLTPALKRFEQRLRSRFAIPVESVDETLSSWDASRRLTAGGMPARRQRGRLDAMAACVILESWFERCIVQHPQHGPAS